MVIDRRKRNIDGSESIVISKDEFWKGMLGALLTSVQRSGPSSPIAKFLEQDPNPLSLVNCKKSQNLEDYAVNLLREFGGIRRYNQIAESLTYNLEILESKKWKILDELNRKLPFKNHLEEQEIANKLMDFKGIKSKQSRSLIQSLGITRYEIPIDSRVMEWLNNEIRFPIKLSSKGMQDENYYRFILTGIRTLCQEAEIFPCELDAMIFSIKEKMQ